MASTGCSKLGFEPVSKLAVGDPARVIGEFAREMNADLVVVGHRKRNMLERWWSGDAGGYISDHINCSLLIARTFVSDEAFEHEFAKAGEPRSPRPSPSSSPPSSRWTRPPPRPSSTPCGTPR